MRYAVTLARHWVSMFVYMFGRETRLVTVRAAVCSFHLLSEPGVRWLSPALSGTWTDQSHPSPGPTAGHARDAARARHTPGLRSKPGGDVRSIQTGMT